MPELDGLRGLAIASVLVWHFIAQQVEAHPGSLLAYVQFGLSFTWAGVDLFFVMSGFLLGSILLRNRGRPDFYQSFYLRRACRIFPLYYLLLAAFAISEPVLQTTPGLAPLWSQDQIPFWSYMLFAQNFTMSLNDTFGAGFLSVTWSLAVEEQFYLFLPVIVMRWGGERFSRVLLAAVAGIIALRAGIYFFTATGAMASYVLMPCRADALLLGVLAAVLWQRQSFREWWTRHQREAWTLIGAIGAAILLLLLARQTAHSAGMAMGGYTLLAAFFALILLASISGPGNILKTTLRCGPLRWLGKISYCVYLIHYPVLIIVQAACGASTHRISSPYDVLVAGLALALTFVIAEFSFRYVESPIINWGHARRFGAAPES